VLQSISLTNYRNLNLDLSIDQRNLIVAPNGTGKSNFLESIYVSSLGKSFRPVDSYADLLGPNGNFAKVSSVYAQHQLELVISNTDKLQRKFILDDKHRPLSKIIGQFPVLIFAPHAVDLALGEPHTRRDDLDDFISLAQPEYHAKLHSYHQILKNRNALLKNIREGFSQSSELEFWNNELVSLATFIVQQRNKFFSEIGSFIVDVAAQIYREDKADFMITYQPNTAEDIDNYREILNQKLIQNSFKEIAVGKTLYGPHKDDYTLSLGKQNLRYLGSRGQQRLAVFIWKLAQHQYLKSLTEESALILIDDLMSELDQHHRENIAEYLLKSDFQFILTGAEIHDIPDELIGGINRISL
jgi:DNA replication and repair protein RecF